MQRCRKSSFLALLCCSAIASAARADLRIPDIDLDLNKKVFTLIELSLTAERARANANASPDSAAALAVSEKKLNEAIQSLSAREREKIPGPLAGQETQLKDALSQRADTLKPSVKERYSQRVKAIQQLRAKFAQPALPDSSREPLAAQAGLLLAASFAGHVLIRRTPA